jgi:hypothetical protein
MIVNRHTWKISHLYHKEFLQLLKTLHAALGIRSRIYTFVFGDADTVIADLEFETIEEESRFWRDLDYSLPEFVAYWERFPDLVETGVTKELLRLH